MDRGGVEAIVEDPELVAKRRSQIVEAATKLFSAQGFYRTTIKDVAKLAGISSGLVYQYFREKDDILLLVLLGVLDAHAREIPTVLEGISDSLERLIAAVAAYCRVVDRHRVETILAYRSTKSLSVDRREVIMRKETETNELIAAAIRAAIKAGYVRKIRVEALAYHIVLVAHGWALKSWYFKSLMTIDEYIRENLDIIFGGILTPAGDRLYRRRAQAVTAGTASRVAPERA
jgi:AcrR family transcriptional regulator